MSQIANFYLCEIGYLESIQERIESEQDEATQMIEALLEDEDVDLSDYTCSGEVHMLLLMYLHENEIDCLVPKSWERLHNFWLSDGGFDFRLYNKEKANEIIGFLYTKLFDTSKESLKKEMIAFAEAAYGSTEYGVYCIRAMEMLFYNLERVDDEHLLIYSLS